MCAKGNFFSAECRCLCVKITEVEVIHCRKFVWMKGNITFVVPATLLDEMTLLNFDNL